MADDKAEGGGEGGEGGEGDKQKAAEKKKKKDLHKKNAADLKNFPNLFPEKDLQNKKVYL